MQRNKHKRVLQFTSEIETISLLLMMIMMILVVNFSNKVHHHTPNFFIEYRKKNVNNHAEAECKRVSEREKGK
jgi:hypothetical protein